METQGKGNQSMGSVPGDTEVSARPWSGANRTRGQAFSFSEEVSQLTHHLAASGTSQEYNGGPRSCLCHVPAVFPSHLVLEREDELSATGHGVQLDSRGTSCRRGGGCAIPPTGLPSPRQSSVYLASAPHIPSATAPGAGAGCGRCRPWPWDGAGCVCPTSGFCCGL